MNNTHIGSSTGKYSRNECTSHNCQFSQNSKHQFNNHYTVDSRLDASSSSDYGSESDRRTFYELPKRPAPVNTKKFEKLFNERAPSYDEYDSRRFYERPPPIVITPKFVPLLNERGLPDVFSRPASASLYGDFDCDNYSPTTGGNRSNSPYSVGSQRYSDGSLALPFNMLKYNSPVFLSEPPNIHHVLRPSNSHSPVVFGELPNPHHVRHANTTQSMSSLSLNPFTEE
jgi:hypothetical protein